MSAHYMHTHAHTCIHTHTGKRKHAHTYARTHAHTRTHTRAHTHTHRQWRASTDSPTIQRCQQHSLAVDALSAVVHSQTGGALHAAYPPLLEGRGGRGRGRAEGKLAHHGLSQGVQRGGGAMDHLGLVALLHRLLRVFVCAQGYRCTRGGMGRGKEEGRVCQRRYDIITRANVLKGSLTLVL